MTKWQLITKKHNGEETSTDQQIDEVGNIYQKSGAVIPKACQKCGDHFDAKVNSVPIKQKIPFYKCDDCSFTTGDPTDAFDHKLEKEHNIKRSQKERVVKYINTLVGSKCNVSIKLDNKHQVKDVFILCDKCNSS